MPASDTFAIAGGGPAGAGDGEALRTQGFDGIRDTFAAASQVLIIGAGRICLEVAAAPAQSGGRHHSGGG